MPLGGTLWLHPAVQGNQTEVDVCPGVHFFLHFTLFTYVWAWGTFEGYPLAAPKGAGESNRGRSRFAFYACIRCTFIHFTVWAWVPLRGTLWPHPVVQGNQTEVDPGMHAFYAKFYARIKYILLD